MKNKLFYLFILAFIFFFKVTIVNATGLNSHTYTIFGKTMGTYYNIVINTHKKVVTSDLKLKIDVQLKMINRQMSVYSKTSEISKFNRADKNKSIHISKDFYKVITAAQKLHRITNGAWDGTVRPLYELWNFDKLEKLSSQIPDQQTIELCLAKTGFQNIIIKEKILIKSIPSLNLDLGSIAKGYGVDAVTSMLKGSGYKNFVVEIGGEVFAAGQKSQMKTWKIGISLPKQGYSDKPYKLIKISEKALATSGTYRNFLKINKKIYSHIINPKTGWPVDNNIVSVSLLADNCMLADGLATGIMVMGRQKGIELVETLDNVECMVVIKRKNEDLILFFSKGFEKYIINKDN